MLFICCVSVELFIVVCCLCSGSCTANERRMLMSLEHLKWRWFLIPRLVQMASMGSAQPQSTCSITPPPLLSPQISYSIAPPHLLSPQSTYCNILLPHPLYSHPKHTFYCSTPSTLTPKHIIFYCPTQSTYSSGSQCRFQGTLNLYVLEALSYDLYKHVL